MGWHPNLNSAELKLQSGQHQFCAICQIVTQCRQHPVTRVAVGIVPNVSQSVGMQARPLCDDGEPSILELRSDLF
jgi:hypothetical protein